VAGVVGEQCRINYGSDGSPEPGPLNSGGGAHNFTEIIFLHTKYIINRQFTDQYTHLEICIAIINCIDLISVLTCSFRLATIFVRICLYCLNSTKFGQLILRKVTETVATRSHIFRL